MNPLYKILGAIAAAAIVVGAIVFLKLKWEAAEARADLEAANAKTATDAAIAAKEALSKLQGQIEGGQQVAAEVMQALQQLQAEAAKRQTRIFNAPLNRDRNDVVPGVVADYYDELQRRQAADSATRAGRSPSP